MKITCLIENTAFDDTMHSEHGLSLFIESNGTNILFDMGQSDLFAINAEKLGVNLLETDIAVLSHGHYDHGGGLKKFFELNSKAPVYLSNHSFEPHYNGTEKYIGLDSSLKNNSRLIFTDKKTSIGNGITLYSCNNMKTILPLDSGGLTEYSENKFIPDRFLHEQYLLIEENSKRILISGCSHKGIVNICEWFRPDVLIGGFHFSKYPLDERLKEFSRKLGKYETEFYTCHCTGTEQFVFMKEYIKNLFYISAGQIIEI